MIRSVCLCLTFKCDLACRHCFVSASPKRTEEMTFTQIETAINNSYQNVHRMWFSGGEPTVVMDKLIFALRCAKKKKDQFGYPNRICVQTNGNFVQNDKAAIEHLALFHNNGANELDITSKDMFHFEQMNKAIPDRLAMIANKMGVFESVTIGGSDYKVIKKLGRAKLVPDEELQDFDLAYAGKCVFTGSDYVIHPNGDVLPCIYGFQNIFGNIYGQTLSAIIQNKTNQDVCRLLENDNIYSLFQSTQCKNNLTDICDCCNNYFAAYRYGRISHA